MTIDIRDASDGDLVMVRGNIAAGDTVVVRGVERLQEGQRVTILTREAAAVKTSGGAQSLAR